MDFSNLKKRIPMQQPNSVSSFQVRLSAGGTTTYPVTLTIAQNRIILRSLFCKYRFESSQVAGIEAISSNEVLIRHTLIEYPAIRFSPSVSAAEIVTQIRNYGFIPSAALEDVPEREGIPVRLSIILAMILPIVFLFFLDRQLGWVQVHSYQLGRYSPLGTSALFLLAFSIRFIPILRNFILESGRHIGELAPLLNLVMLASGFLSVIGISVLLGTPEILVISLCFGIFWIVAMIINKLNGEVHEA
jgi:hypothetical protein